jgi:hypothetical protein
MKNFAVSGDFFDAAQARLHGRCKASRRFGAGIERLQTDWPPA